MLRITFVVLLLAFSVNGQGNDQEIMEKVRDMFPICRIGQDYYGSGVYYAPYAAWKFGELASSGTPAEMKAFEVLPDEILSDFIDNSGSNLAGITLIVDHAGLNMADWLSPDALKTSLRMYARNKQFSKAVKRVVFINSGIYARTFASVWNPLLGDVWGRTEVYGTNPEEWVPELLRTVPSEALPQGFGGTNLMPQGCAREETKRPHNFPTPGTLRSAVAFIGQNPFQLVSAGASAFSRAVGNVPSAFGSSC